MSGWFKVAGGRSVQAAGVEREFARLVRENRRLKAKVATLEDRLGAYESAAVKASTRDKRSR